jgi:hypothetical protein
MLSGCTRNSCSAVHPSPCASATNQVTMSRQLSRTETHRLGGMYRQGEACGEMFSKAPCHMATGFGSRVGARPADLRPSYGKRRSETMRREAGFPDIG